MNGFRPKIPALYIILLLALEVQELSAESWLQYVTLSARYEEFDNPDPNRIDVTVKATGRYRGGGDLVGKLWVIGCFLNDGTRMSPLDYTFDPSLTHWEISQFNDNNKIDRVGDEIRCPGAGGPIPLCKGEFGNRVVGWSNLDVHNVPSLEPFGGVYAHRPLDRRSLTCKKFSEVVFDVEGLDESDQLEVELEGINRDGQVEWKKFEFSLDQSAVRSFWMLHHTDFRLAVTRAPEHKQCIVAPGNESEYSGVITGKMPKLSVTCSCVDGSESCPEGVELGGTVDGLVSPEWVQLRLESVHEGIVRPFYTTAHSDGNFEFREALSVGSTWNLVVDVISNPRKHCSVTKGESGTVEANEVPDAEIICMCADGEGPATDGCGFDEAAMKELFDPDPLNRIPEDLCNIFDALCVGLSPWWGWGAGPPGGCERGTNCTDGGLTCHPADDGTEICAPTLNCHDKCAGTAAVQLFGPALYVEWPPGSVDERLVVTGFARDADGVHDLLFYLDGERLSPLEYSRDLLRFDSCAGVAGECDPNVGFHAVFDSIAWTDGARRLDVVAVDREPSYPMGARQHHLVDVDHTCSATTPPTVTLTEPAAGVTLRDTIPVQAAVAPSEDVRRVEFFVDGARGFSDWSPPFEWNWDTSTVADGEHVLRARIHDECGRAALSDEVRIMVSNFHPAPILEVEVPTPWAQISGSSFEVSGWAMDANGIASVDIRIDGSQVALSGPIEPRSRPEICSALGGDDPRCPEVGWSARFDTTLFPDGMHELAVVVTDGRGKSTSRAQPVDIANGLPAPPGVSSPGSQTKVVGSSVTFEVNAFGEEPFAYQWEERVGHRWLDLYDGGRSGRVSGARTSSLTIASIDFSDAGGYRCRVMNIGGASYSTSASLTVIEQVDPPTVTAGIDQAVTVGDPVELRVTAQGEGPLSYRWERLVGSQWVALYDDGNLSGTATDALNIASTALDHEGYYRCRVTNGGGTTDSQLIRLTVDDDPSGTCLPDSYTLCLQQNRFEVTVSITGSQAPVIHWSELGGFFRRSNPENVEVAVKVLDGLAINGRYWVFHGSLTDLAYTVTVTDTITGQTKDYFKPSGTFCGEADTTAFGGSSSATGATELPLGPAWLAASSAACQSSTTAACLLGSRFRVEVLQFGSPQRASPLSSFSATFSFGSTANPEVVVKVLDGTVVNDWYWVFFGSLTHQDYFVRVTDTATGQVKEYPSPGDSCGMADTTAF